MIIVQNSARCTGHCSDSLLLVIKLSDRLQWPVTCSGSNNVHYQWRTDEHMTYLLGEIASWSYGLIARAYKQYKATVNKAIVDSRLRPQWCFHLANVTEMEQTLDCKLDALIRSFAWEKKRFSCQHKSARITWPLTLTLSTPSMQAYLGTIVCKFGGDPAICLRELMVGANSHEFITLYIVDKLIAIPRAAAIAGVRSN